MDGELAIFSGKRSDRNGSAVIIRAILTDSVGTRKCAVTPTTGTSFNFNAGSRRLPAYYAPKGDGSGK